MSVKNNTLLASAVAALALTLTPAREAIAETLMDNIEVSAINFAEVTAAGGCIGIVSIATGTLGAVEVRAIANANGDVKLFANLAAAAVLVKRCKMSTGAEVKYIRMDDTASATNPVNRLIAAYKSASRDKVSATSKVADLDGLIVAAVGAGDDTAVGTPNYKQWQDYGKRKQTVLEVKDWSTAAMVTLAASLTAAGVNPLTLV